MPSHAILAESADDGGVGAEVEFAGAVDDGEIMSVTEIVFAWLASSSPVTVIVPE